MWSVAMARRLTELKMLVKVLKNIAIVANIGNYSKLIVTTCHISSFAALWLRVRLISFM
jgi:hypothetical protein